MLTWLVVIEQSTEYRDTEALHPSFSQCGFLTEKGGQSKQIDTNPNFYHGKKKYILLLYGML